jgi:hypothetical protein
MEFVILDGSIPSKRPAAVEIIRNERNALILKRVIKRIRAMMEKKIIINDMGEID